ncbi:MAG: zinc-binding alcohol dehydrogenase [Clostridiales bacterium]|jgi:threonine dehydrogenase-like Zn-dependent dehydrogenase|nr:zinc-binding alcohol dehydrogenase [Clostridiales bacterium]
MKRIEFVAKNIAEIRETPMVSPLNNDVVVRMHYTAISAGTEYANLTGHSSVSGIRGKTTPDFPRVSGYSGSGIVEEVGSSVTDLKPGERVVTYWGKHQQYNTLPRRNIVRIPSADITMDEAALVFISTFSLSAIRKTKPELGESCLVVGLGLLGQFSIQFARLNGTLPIIAADTQHERRILALKNGADAVFNPTEEDYDEQVRSLTNGKGANIAIEATGNSSALSDTLQCCAKFARVALLGCSRDPTTVDFYHDVHYPGITLIGAHTHARPMYESYPGNWSHADDCTAVLYYLMSGRLSFRNMISEVHSPMDAQSVYNRLVYERDFPIGVLFDWSCLAD